MRKVSRIVFRQFRGTDASHYNLPKVTVVPGDIHPMCDIHRGPNNETVPPELLSDRSGERKTCQNIIFCGGTGNTQCNNALRPYPTVVNTLCELPYTPPPPDQPLPDKYLAMKFSADTSSCPGLPMPTNTRLENLLTSRYGTAFSSENWVLACRKPESTMGVGNIVSNIETRTIPAGTEGIIVNFHYFCGK